jgi:hypothetical protein
VEVPVPAPEGARPQIFDTGQVSAGAGLKEYLGYVEQAALRFFLRELTTAPDASGAAKVVEVLAGKSPLLAHVAGNMEECQWAVLEFAERRWTGTAAPQAAVTWPRDFDLRTAAEKVLDVLGVFKEAGVAPPAGLGAKLLRAAVDGAGLLAGGGGADLDAAEEDLRRQLGAAVTSAEANARRTAAAAEADERFRAALDAVGQPPGGDGAPTSPPEVP